MRQEQAGSDGEVIAAQGLSLRKAVAALRPGGSRRRRSAEASSVGYEDGIGALTCVVLLSSAVELVLVDILFSVLWMRVVALTLGLLVVLGILSFVAALRAYPHRVADGTLTIHSGAWFELAVPLERVTVAERKAMVNQKRIAEVSDGVLSVPVMGLTNLLLTLDPPIQVHLKKTGTAVVREIKMYAVDPRSGAQKLRSGGRPADDDEMRMQSGPVGA
jgi:hypothetical protein